MATPTSEAHWVLLAQCDDRDALDRLIRSVQPVLHRYIRSLVGAADADDVTQDVLVVVCRKLGWLHDATLFRPWAFRIASRASFRFLKRKRRTLEDRREEMVLDEIPAAAETSHSAEWLEELLETDAVSPASRAVLVLHFGEELSLPEIAAVLEIPIGTVKSRLAYGLTTLRKRLGTRRSS